MTIQVSTLRPGLLVSLKSTLKGNVRYHVRDVEAEHPIGDGATKTTWETERVISDKDELARATKARASARDTVVRICSDSAFGLLCRQDRHDELQEAIAQARQITEEFNRTATCTSVAVYAIVGRVEQNDAEAVRAINSEVRDLMAAMASGIENLDAAAVRKAATRARSVGNMLTEGASEKIKEAIAAARTAARKITKAGEQAAQEIDRESIAKINSARTAFLDFAEGDAVETATPAAQGRAVDLVTLMAEEKVEAPEPVQEPVVEVPAPRPVKAAIEIPEVVEAPKPQPRKARAKVDIEIPEEVKPRGRDPELFEKIRAQDEARRQKARDAFNAEYEARQAARRLRDKARRAKQKETRNAV